MKVGLSVCATLLLDPYEMVGISAKQKKPAELKPQTAIDNISEAVLPKKVGRKQIKRNIMLVYLNFRDYSIMVPYPCQVSLAATLQTPYLAPLLVFCT